MSALKYGFFYFLETILRFVPVPQKTGLVKIGKPGRDSPVLVTGNYHLTVLKVKRALKGQDVFLLVAKSRGINVWCAAAGGHFTHHDVISAIKLSRIENFVDHRTVILPQLAACGVEAKIIQKRTGWKVKWGTVDIEDFPAAMRVVRFPLRSRLEMATAWAFWMSGVFSLVFIFFKPAAVVPAVVMVWLMAFFVFSAFPVYLPLVRPDGVDRLWEKRRIGRTIFLICFLLLVLAGVLLYGVLTSRLTSGFFLFWGLASAVAAVVLTGDLAGSTPHLVSEFREEKGFQIGVDGVAGLAEIGIGTIRVDLGNDIENTTVNEVGHLWVLPVSGEEIVDRVKTRFRAAHFTGVCVPVDVDTGFVLCRPLRTIRNLHAPEVLTLETLPDGVELGQFLVGSSEAF